VLLAESLHRLKTAEPELVRKVVHIGVGNVILLAWWLQIPTWLGVSASALFSAIALLSYRISILPSIDSVGRKSLGTFFYAISFGVLIASFWSSQPQYAILGILVMTWGDGLAALVGQRFGQHLYKLWGIQKSLEGSLAMGLASYCVSSVVLLIAQGNSWQTWVVSLAVAIAATGLEAFSKLGIDNLTVPLGSAAIAFFLNQLLLS
jgi:phytol kinase